MTEFVYETSVPVRLADLDYLGIVNNAVYATYLEEARKRFFLDVTGRPLVDLDAVVVALSIQYHRPVEAVDAVDVAIGIDHLGTSSIELAYEIRSEGERTTSAQTTQVCIDREANEARPIPETIRDPLELVQRSPDDAAA